MEKIIKKLKEEIERIEKELAVDIPKELQKAVAQGDISDNAEYQSAKERQFYLSARVAQLKERLAKISMMNLNDIPRDKVAYGSKVYLRDANSGEEMVYKLVFPEEVDVSKGLISITSPIGKKLLGKEEGMEVEIFVPSGVRKFEILKIITIHDEEGEENE
ncbi:MAG: GreA/GreB family elongation factor [Candidatus Aminicenantia bacterium]